MDGDRCTRKGEAAWTGDPEHALHTHDAVEGEGVSPGQVRGGHVRIALRDALVRAEASGAHPERSTNRACGPGHLPAEVLYVGVEAGATVRVVRPSRVTDNRVEPVERVIQAMPDLVSRDVPRKLS